MNRHPHLHPSRGFVQRFRYPHYRQNQNLRPVTARRSASVSDPSSDGNLEGEGGTWTLKEVDVLGSNVRPPYWITPGDCGAVWKDSSR